MSAALFSHPLSWCRISSRNKCHSDPAWVKSHNVSPREVCQHEKALGNGDSAAANNLQDCWFDLEATLSLAWGRTTGSRTVPSIGMAFKRPTFPVVVTADTLTPATPLLVQSPASSISSAASTILIRLGRWQEGDPGGKYHRTSNRSSLAVNRRTRIISNNRHLSDS